MILCNLYKVFSFGTKTRQEKDHPRHMLFEEVYMMEKTQVEVKNAVST